MCCMTPALAPGAGVGHQMDHEAAAEKPSHHSDRPETLLDVLQRRYALGEMERIRAVCQPELGWSDQRWQAEVSNYLALWQRSYGLPGAENSSISAGIPMACPTLEAR